MPYDESKHGDFCSYMMYHLLDALEEYAVIVSDEMETLSQGINKVTFSLGKQNQAYLRPKKDTDTSYVDCYFLPWRRADTAICHLDGTTGARLFFTSHLTGCRLSVKYDSSDQQGVTVIHIAGDIKFSEPSKWGGTTNLAGPRARDKAEQNAFGAPSTSTPKLTRRFSFTKDYAGGSAFVFGARTDEGKWIFLAQVAEGSLSSADLDPNKNITIVAPYKII